MAVMAKRYDTVHQSCQGEYGGFLIGKLNLQRGNKVLDLGCGSGFLSAVLAHRVGPEGNVIGIDPNRGRLQVARSKYGEIMNLQFCEGSSENFPPGPYDLIFSNLVLQWIKNKEYTFKYVYDNLKSGGVFAFLCPGGQAPKIWEMLNPSISNSLHFCSSSTYEHLAIKQGFEIDFKSEETVRHYFQNVDEYIDWSLATMNVAEDEIDETLVMKIKESADPFTDILKITFILKRP